MGAVREVELPILDGYGAERGLLRISLLPRSERDDALLDLRHEADRNPALEPVQLLEEEEYRYELFMEGLLEIGPVIIEPTEIFESDTQSGRTGRLRPRAYTGSLPVVILVGGQVWGRVAFEVRSAKLDYLRHYQWMLQDIAEGMTEAVMERFAPTEQRFALDETESAATLYQRFTFIKHLLTGEVLSAAMQQIIGRPHRRWVTEEEIRPIGRGLSAGSQGIRQIVNSPGARMEWPSGPIAHIPVRIRTARSEETLDTPENRFVKFVLSHWRNLVDEILRRLAAGPSGPAVRGRRELQAVIDRFDEILAAELFREVGPLTQFPANSQVLQKRAGYRELFRLYVQSEAAAVLTWEGGEDVYAAGQRNVATLYEYWVFLQMAKVTAALCDGPFNQEALFQVSPDGLGIQLKQGQQKLLHGIVSRLGRRMRIELWFNRTFKQGADSWTLAMRPDCSLSIRPHEGEEASFEAVWLHFDAKYRLEHLRTLFALEPTDDTALLDEQDELGRAKRVDLLKMHAYRDAIRRSAGAYVVYPGTDPCRYPIYHEILPGLGAFPLRPTDGGEAEGGQLLTIFLEEVLLHMASQTSQHERARFWVRESYAPPFGSDREVAAASFLDRPPADTGVLLGFVKSREHLAWIRQLGLYNLRADQRRGSVGLRLQELTTDLLVLYGDDLAQPLLIRVTGVPEIRTAEHLQGLGYPNPRGQLYLCLPVEELPVGPWTHLLTNERVRAVRNLKKPEALRGEPVVVSWFDLAVPWNGK